MSRSPKNRSHATLRSSVRIALERAGLGRPAMAAWLRLRGPELIKHDWQIWRDYRRFRSRYDFLSGGAPRIVRGRVLIISLSDFVAQIKMESILAKALQLRGCEPVIVTNATLKRAHRLYRVFGFDKLAFFDRYVDDLPPAAGDSGIESVWSGMPSIDSVKAFRYHGVEVGRQALATLLRGAHLGRVDVSDPEMRGRLTALMDTGVEAVRAAERLLDEVRPNLAIINDAMYIGIGGIFEAALNRDIPVIQWVGSTRDDALALKRFDRETHRTHPISLSAESWRLVSELPWTPERDGELTQDFRDRYLDGRWTSYYNRTYGSLRTPQEIHAELGTDPRRKTATIFAHILWDSTMFWGDDLFDDYQDWLVETLKSAARNTAVNWIVKLHPGNVWKSKRDGLVGESVDERVARAAIRPWPSHIKLLAPDAPISTYSILQASDYCVTVRGTVGIEAAALGIPVLTAGTGRYSGLGFTHDFTSRDDYLRVVDRIQDIPRLTHAQTELARKYAHALFVLRPARFQTFELTTLSLSEAGHPLDHNVTMHARSLEELERAADLRAFAEWAIDSTDRDFMSASSDALTSLAAAASVRAHGGPEGPPLRLQD